MNTGRTGFEIVDGDAARGRAPAVPHHWLVCVGLAIIAQWILFTGDAVVRVVASSFAGWGSLDEVGSPPAMSEDALRAIIVTQALASLALPSAIMGGLLLHLQRKADQRSTRALGLTSRAFAESWLCVLVGLVAAAPIIVMLLSEKPAAWFSDATIAVLLLTLPTIVQAGAEELLFRGVLMTSLVARYGARAGVLGSALLFSLWHFGFQGTLFNLTLELGSTFVFGVTAALLVLRQGHLGGVIALHVVWNVMHSLGADFDNDDFWSGFMMHRPWVLTDLQRGDVFGIEFLPLFIETLLIYAMCRGTVSIVFGRPENVTE